MLPAFPRDRVSWNRNEKMREGAGVDVDMRLLRYFVAVAEELSFTGAAQRLFESQPTVSRKVRRLEETLRVELFRRVGKEVRLTPAGVVLLAPARRLVADWAAAVDRARAVGAGGTTTLRVGFALTGGGPLMARAHEAFVRRYAGVVVEPTRLEWGTEAAAVRRGEVDVVFVWLPASIAGLDLAVVAAEQRMVGVPAAHRLAGHAVLIPADLAGVPLVGLRTPALASARWSGTVPGAAWGPAAGNLDELLEHVAAGSAGCVVPESVSAYHHRPNVVWRPLRGVEPVRIALAWRSGRQPRTVSRYVALVRELAGSGLAGTPAAAVRERRAPAHGLPHVHVPANSVEVRADVLD
jgi:DNA-binding transcriptional LysR family regulator